MAYKYPPREIIDPEEVKRSMVESQVRRSNAAMAEYEEREKRRIKTLESAPKESESHVNHDPVLKSTLLKNEENMNALGKGSFSSLSLGMKSFEVLKAQEALKEVNAFQCKANGNFDSATEQAVKTFQQEYEPTHTTHENYQLGGIDGVIDKNTILALDESVVEGWKVPEINPNNMYWPPYNFLAKEGEKEIHVRYTQDVVETTVLAPEEWQEFFDTLDKTQNIGGAMKGTYDAFDTAKKLGGFGVTAYVKTHNGVDYLILKGYKQHMKTLLAGNRFKASNPQVVKLSLGALDSVKGMARYVKVTAPMEILVGSAINVLKYVLDDEYTLKDLGVDEAKLLVNVLAVAGTALIVGAAFPALAATAVGSGVILVGSSLSVWALDQATDFEKISVEKILESLE